MPAQIKDIKSREILDSRGNPTIETRVFLDNDIQAEACVPSGASLGTYEALELRDNDPNRYMGKGVLTAIDNIIKFIKPQLLNEDITKQDIIDQRMIEIDGTSNKGRLGANAILSVSLAVARAASFYSHIPLYQYIKKLVNNNSISNITPIFNVINGGMHASGKIPFQEFILVPNPTLIYEDALRMGVEIYHDIKSYLKQETLGTSIGDEGGFTPQVSSNTEVLELMKKVINGTKYVYGKDIFIGLDIASSTFYKSGCYYPENSSTQLNPQDYIEYLLKLNNEYDFYSLEDPLSEDDWNSWKDLTSKIGSDTIVIGDDLLVTNKTRLQKAIETKACNAILIKLNQIGTLTETLDVIKLAQSSNFKIIISHRSGETNDTFISDLAVGVGADFIKAGAPARGERVAKYNRLKEIYEEACSI
jgi:enolase